MRDYYSVQALYNLLFWPITYRFADHLSGISDPSAKGYADGHNNLSRPIYHNTGCKDDLGLNTLKRDLHRQRHPRTAPAQAAEGRG